MLSCCIRVTTRRPILIVSTAQLKLFNYNLVKNLDVKLTVITPPRHFLPQRNVQCYLHLDTARNEAQIDCCH